MLGLLCARPKPCLFASAVPVASQHHRLIRIPLKLLTNGEDFRQRRHLSACRIGGGYHGGGAASIWHAILPASGNYLRPCFHHGQKGEGSWNVTWDARPARWLHRPDFFFGVCACFAPPLEVIELTPDSVTAGDVTEVAITNERVSANYKVTGVPADGRCLFRAIAHISCLRNGEEAPDENRQTELADELRAQVVAELVRRRKETEWFIEEDFDAYVKRIQKPYVWGGEPELLMASHVLKTKISVFMLDRRSGSLINIANYGEEYYKDEEVPIKVLFHGYGHYDILEVPDKS